MGYKYTDAVFKANLDGPLKQVLLGIAWYANNKTGICWPSHQQVADAVGISRESSKRYRPKLRELGLIVSKGQHLTPRGPVEILWVNLKEIERLTGPTLATVEKSDSTSEDRVPDKSWLEALDSDPGLSEPSIRVSENRVPGSSSTPTGVSETLKPGIGPGIENQELKPAMSNPMQEDLSASLETSPSQDQTRKSNTRDFAPHPTGDFSPPDPPGSCYARA